MQRAQINKINVDRLTSWKNRLNEHHSTPMLLVGVGHDHKQGELMVLVTEERTDYEILLLMREALRMLEQQHASKN